MEDGIEKYVVNEESGKEGGIKDWILKSHNLSEKVKDERVKREKRESEDLKKREKMARQLANEDKSITG